MDFSSCFSGYYSLVPVQTITSFVDKRLPGGPGWPGFQSPHAFPGLLFFCGKTSGNLLNDNFEKVYAEHGPNDKMDPNHHHDTAAEFLQGNLPPAKPLYFG
jgi:hypothetical protein